MSDYKTILDQWIEKMPGGIAKMTCRDCGKPFISELAQADQYIFNRWDKNTGEVHAWFICNECTLKTDPA